jgi:hypothetical protein
MPPPKPYTFTYAAKDFRSGLAVGYEIVDLNGTLTLAGSGVEVGSTGIYKAVISLPRGRYICRISEPIGFWRAYKDIIIE